MFLGLRQCHFSSRLECQRPHFTDRNAEAGGKGLAQGQRGGGATNQESQAFCIPARVLGHTALLQDGATLYLFNQCHLVPV